MNSAAPSPLRAPKFAPASAFSVELEAAVGEYFRVHAHFAGHKHGLGFLLDEL